MEDSRRSPHAAEQRGGSPATGRGTSHRPFLTALGQGPTFASFPDEEGRSFSTPARVRSIVVVKCSWCGTRYHNPWEQHADHARCSCCDEMVPLVAAKRDYLLLPTGPCLRGAEARAAARGIGMDDPLLAERLRATAAGADGEAASGALTYRISGDESGAADQEARPLDLLLQSARDEEQDQPQPNSLRELLVTILLTSVGVAAAYHLSRDQGLDPTLWVGAGGLWGLILGWLSIQWMRQRS